MDKERNSQNLLVAGAPGEDAPELRTVEELDTVAAGPATLSTTDLQELLENLDIAELNPPPSGAWKPDSQTKATQEQSTPTPPPTSIQASTYRPNIDVDQLLGLKNLVNDEQDVSGEEEKVRISETELQRLLGELNREEFRAPEQAWNIRKAANLLRQKINRGNVIQQQVHFNIFKDNQFSYVVYKDNTLYCIIFGCISKLLLLHKTNLKFSRLNVII